MEELGLTDEEEDRYVIVEGWKQLRKIRKFDDYLVSRNVEFVPRGIREAGGI